MVFKGLSKKNERWGQTPAGFYQLQLQGGLK